MPNSVMENPKFNLAGVSQEELAKLEEDLKEYFQCVRDASLPGKVVCGALSASLFMSLKKVKPPNILLKKLIMAFGTYVCTSLTWTLFSSTLCRNHMQDGLEKFQAERFKKQHKERTPNNEEKTNVPEYESSNSRKNLNDFDFTPDYSSSLDLGTPLSLSNDSQNEKVESETKKHTSYDDLSYLNRKEYYFRKKENFTQGKTPLAEKTEFDNEFIDGEKQGKRMNKYGDIIE